MKKRSIFLLFATLMIVLAFVSCHKADRKINVCFIVDSEVYRMTSTDGKSEIELPNTPTKTGYTFDGWYYDEGEWKKPFSQDSIMDNATSKDVKVYAKWDPIKYTAVFKSGNDVVKEQIFTIETENITEPSIPKREGYIGVWESYELGTSDIVINAEYTPKKYTITYENLNGAENPNAIEYTIESEKISLASITRDGYTFVGWYNDGIFVTEIPRGSTGDIKLVAKWNPIKYMIAYHDLYNAENPNGETYDVEHEPVVLYDAIREGYNFLGWYNSENEKVMEIPQGTTGAIDLYAKWEPIKYTASFIYDKTVLVEQEFTLDDVAINEPSVPKKNGYNGAWESYSLEAKDITINAIYIPIKYNVNLLDSDGTTILQAFEYTIESEAITLLDATKAGYDFEGWYDEEGRVTEIPSGSTGALEFVAKWSIVEYTISYIDEMSAGNANNPTTYTVESDTIILSEPSITGYIFLGWYYDGEKITEIKKGTTQSYELVAMWQVKTYDVKLETGDGEKMPSVTYNHGSGLELPIPVYEGYVFGGWLDEEGAEIGQYEIEAGTFGDKTLYAKWVEEDLAVTVVFDTDGGTKIGNQVYRKGQRVSLPESTKSGVFFDGWYNEAYNTEYYKGFTITESITVYAKWVESIPVSNAAELIAISSDPSKSYHLVQDIDMQGVSFNCLGEFLGMLNGNGYTISNLTIGGNAFISTNAGTIKNLNFVNVNNTFSSSIDGSQCAIIAQMNTGKIINVSILSGAISFNKTINSASDDGWNDLHVGGVVAANFGSIISCNSYVNISGNTGVVSKMSAAYIGGLAAVGNGVISDCYVESTLWITATGNSEWANNMFYMGGLIGSNWSASQIDRCVANCNMTLTYGNTKGMIFGYVGGFAGTLGSGAAINDCYAIGSLYSAGRYSSNYASHGFTPCTGGFIGVLLDATINNCYSTTEVTTAGMTHIAGGFVGSANGSSLINGCFTTQNSFVGGANGSITNSYSISDKTKNELISVDFVYNTLGFSKDVWLADGEALPELAWKKQ